MIRTLIGILAALALVGCGVDDSAIVIRNDATNTERFEDFSEEAALRLSDTHDAVFEAAGKEFNVPPALLKSLAWSLTRYEMITSEGEFEGARPTFGMMALTPELMAEALSMAQVTEEQAKTEVAANVRVAAAWLSKRHA